MKAAAWRETLGFGALCLMALPAGAVALGDIEVRSQAGAPLEARIPVLAQDEPLRGACFSLAPRGSTPLPGPSLELRRSAHGMSLFVRTREPVAEGSAFAIAIACPGSASVPAAEYSVHFAAPAERHPASASTAGALPVVANLVVREGDTLGSLAEAFFPRDEAARARYLGAIRAENPGLASLADEAPLTPGTTVALPDLHAFAATVAPRHTAPSGTAASPRATRARADASASRSAPRAVAASSTPARSGRAASASPIRNERRAATQEGFRLRLSAPVMDLAPSRDMDARKRAALRERLMDLEADDRTAAMLAMREDIRRLEAQVQQLKLRLATMPPVAAPAPAEVPETQAATARAAKAEATRAQPAVAQAPIAQSASKEALQSETKKAEPPAAEAPRTEPIRSTTPAPAAAGPAKVPQERRKPVVIPRAPGDEPWYSDVLWWLRLLLVPLAGVLGLRYFARRRAAPIGDYAEDDLAPDLAITEPGAEAADTEPPRDEEARPEPPDESATRIPAEDNLELRRRYIEERFPEIVNGAVALDDPRSMVKAARLLYDDGAFARAIELLQFAIEQDPDAMPAWLALFAIFRLQGLKGEFAELGRRFAERHGASDEWRDVRAIGRALDPANALYEGEEVIAPLGGGPEGWLQATDDAARGRLAGELRSRLMSEASITDADLVPDPIPALRKAEVFSVA